jgi:hypothetical protein
MGRGRGVAGTRRTHRSSRARKKALRMTNGKAKAESTDFDGSSPGKWIPYVGGKWFFPIPIEFVTFGGDR